MTIQIPPEVCPSTVFYQVFKDFDAYEDVFQHAQVRMTLHRRERPHWAIGQMDLGKLHLQWGTSGGGMVSEGEILPGGHVLFVPLSNFTTNGINGCRLTEDSIMIASAGSEFCVSADSWNDWFSLFIPHETTGGEGTDIDQEVSCGCGVVTLCSEQMRQVRWAVREAIRLASNDGLHPLMAAKTESMLLQFAKSAVTAKRSTTNSDRGRPRMDRHGVVALVRDCWARQSTRVGELADVGRVSERTLFRIFQDWFGISPARYERLQKLHAVRDTLLEVDPTSATVTSVLAQHDIEQFGRFAGIYRALFGESPLETLARQRRYSKSREGMSSE